MNTLFTVKELNDLYLKINEIKKISSKNLNPKYCNDTCLSFPLLDTTKSLAMVSLLFIDIISNRVPSKESKESIITNINNTYNSMKIYEIECTI